MTSKSNWRIGKDHDDAIENAQLRRELEDQYSRFSRLTADALTALSQFQATPEGGYMKEPFLLQGDISRLGRERDALKARVAELEIVVANAAGCGGACMACAAKLSRVLDGSNNAK